MSNESPNPYDAPSGSAQTHDAGSMQYMYAFQYVFENPNWMTNVLLATVCFLIPVVGPIVVLGYQFVIIEALHRWKGQPYPDFDFGQFGALLTRGIWPFLVGLIAQFVMTPLMIILYFVMICGLGGMAAAMEGADAGGLGAVCMLVGFVFIFLLMIGAGVLMGMVMIPMFLAAGLSQELGPAFNFGFIKDFIGKTWKEIILSSLFMSLMGMVLTSVGLLVFCIGVYVAIAFLALANAHIMLQLYEVYLARGGAPIKPKADKQPA